MASASSCSPSSVRSALASVTPDTIAGYHATHRIVKHTMPSETGRLVFSVIGARSRSASPTSDNDGCLARTMRTGHRHAANAIDGVGGPRQLQAAPFSSSCRNDDRDAEHLALKALAIEVAYSAVGQGRRMEATLRGVLSAGSGVPAILDEKPTY